jgi:hypothetical protein
MRSPALPGPARKITGVEVNVKACKSWADAEFQQPVLSLALVRFRFLLKWDGSETIIQSRCTNETGHGQPTHDEFTAAYGTHGCYRYHAIRPSESWPRGRLPPMSKRIPTAAAQPEFARPAGHT